MISASTKSDVQHYVGHFVETLNKNMQKSPSFTLFFVCVWCEGSSIDIFKCELHWQIFLCTFSLGPKWKLNYNVFNASPEVSPKYGSDHAERVTSFSLCLININVNRNKKNL